MATVVLAHGAWSADWAWKKVRPLMAASGHDFYIPTYTGIGSRLHLANPSIDLETHIADVLGVIETEELTDVVLMGHSYGGLVATGVADRARDRIRHLIYLDAFVPKNGQSAFDLLSPAEAERIGGSAAAGDGWRMAPNPPPADTSDEDKAWIVRHRNPHPLKCFNMPLRFRNGDLTVGRSNITAMRFSEHLPFLKFADRARSESGWRQYEIDASHNPNVTAPEALVALLNKIISANT